MTRFPDGREHPLESLKGIGRLWRASEESLTSVKLLAAVRAFSERQPEGAGVAELAFYPDSPWIV